MPYIKQDRREKYNNDINRLVKTIRKNGMQPGDVNYCITKLLIDLFGDHETTNYRDIANAVGILETVKLEFYRVVASPYESVKAGENGWVQRTAEEDDQ